MSERLRTAALVMAFGCSCLSVVITFLGLSQFDLPIVRYVRSVTIQLSLNQLAIPWMAFTSHAGNWIGEGTHLVVFSLVLGGAGWLFSSEAVRNAGIQTLLAHGLAALLVNGLKHLIGRPRPKFAHSGDWQFAPSWVSGFDSFPSGHSAASFAVATVLAKRFPVFGPLCLGVAAFVMLSRVLRGSHFPTDVVGGAIVGVLSGAIAAAPLKEWRTSLRDGIGQSAVGAVVLLALLWSLARGPEEGIVGMLLSALGLAAIAAGLWLRRTQWTSSEPSGSSQHATISSLLLCYGMASMTTSLYVVAAAGLACLAYWPHQVGSLGEQTRDLRSWRPDLVHDVCRSGSPAVPVTCVVRKACPLTRRTWSARHEMCETVGASGRMVSVERLGTEPSRVQGLTRSAGSREGHSRAA
ncbi:MAG: phosphatase PAP2 family protein [Nitrospira sp.]|nr:phosphatase PAP2 family protein [Nitrospira sp.]